MKNYETPKMKLHVLKTGKIICASDPISDKTGKTNLDDWSTQEVTMED